MKRSDTVLSWHRLDKNPNDLPEYPGTYLTAYRIYDDIISYHINMYDTDIKESDQIQQKLKPKYWIEDFTGDLIAWSYIPMITDTD